MRRRRTTAIVRMTILTSTLTLTTAGCGSSGTVSVMGTLVKGGAPYKVPAGQKVGVTLYQVSSSDNAAPAGEPFEAEVDSEKATFRVPGPEGRGVPLGKYRVAVRQRWTREGLASAKTAKNEVLDRDKDFLNDAFSPSSSPIVKDVTGPSELKIEIDHAETAVARASGPAAAGSAPERGRSAGNARNQRDR